MKTEFLPVRDSIDKRCTQVCISHLFAKTICKKCQSRIRIAECKIKLDYMRSTVHRVERCTIASFQLHNVSRDEMRIIVCSQCGIPRLEANHWFIAWTEQSGQRFCFMSMDSDPMMARRDGVQTLCGQRCLHRAIQRYSDSIPRF